MPDVRGLARRIHAYMSSPDCEGGDGPATALGKIEAAVRKEYADMEAENQRLQDENGQLALWKDAAIRGYPSIAKELADYQKRPTETEQVKEIERLQHDAALVAFLDRPDVVVGLSEGAEVLVHIRESECEGCGDNVVSAARMAMFMEQKQAAKAEEE